MRIFTPLVLSLIYILGVNAQANLEDLSYYGDIMVNAFEPKHRDRASKDFEELLDSYIQTATYDTDNWTTVKPYTRLLYSPDSTVILVTWQVDKGSYPLHYGGYVISNGENTKLQQSTTFSKDLEYMQLGGEDWYGALYYNILPVKGKNDAYLLFGYNQNDKYEKSKIIDIVTLAKDGRPQFGSELFVTQAEGSRDNVRNRVLISYSSEANATVNYNSSLDLIIFDHLMPVAGQQQGQGNTFVPDGTYEGYQWKSGKFLYKAKIFDQVYDEAPRPEPVLNGRGTDIIGRTKELKD